MTRKDKPIEICKSCDKQIKAMTFLGTGVCSDTCMKKLYGTASFNQLGK